MGKRSNFERNPRDYYPTPIEAVYPLLPYLPAGSSFVEPCAGDGRLVRHLQRFGHRCEYACDIEPQAEGIDTQDVLFFGFKLPAADFIITNPPWERDSLHEMISAFRVQAPTWLLFDADWIHTAQAVPFLRYCQRIVSVGRVSWMENGQSGMDNCCWFLFGAEPGETVFTGRAA